MTEDRKLIVARIFGRQARWYGYDYTEQLKRMSDEERQAYLEGYHEAGEIDREIAEDNE